MRGRVERNKREEEQRGKRKGRGMGGAELWVESSPSVGRAVAPQVMEVYAGSWLPGLVGIVQ